MRLLLIDATPSAGARLGRALEAHGYTVTRLCGGAHPDDALPGSYDACLLVLEHLAVRQTYAAWLTLGIPTLVFAREIAPEDLVACLDAGAADVVSSPVQLAEISARLRSVVRRQLAVPEPDLNVGPLRLDTVAHRAWRERAELRLSAREFALLETFMRAPGRVLSRQLLLESVWDVAELADDTNVVDQYVGHLRRKLDRPFGTHDLQTVRGLGYRLAA